MIVRDNYSLDGLFIAGICGKICLLHSENVEGKVSNINEVSKSSY
jgi:hypothetical protein